MLEKPCVLVKTGWRDYRTGRARADAEGSLDGCLLHATGETSPAHALVIACGCHIVHPSVSGTCEDSLRKSMASPRGTGLYLFFNLLPSTVQAVLSVHLGHVWGSQEASSGCVRNIGCLE